MLGSAANRSSNASIRAVINWRRRSVSAIGRRSDVGYELVRTGGGAELRDTVGPRSVCAATSRRLLYLTASQHRADLRFFPWRPAFSTLAMYSNASGTLHAVSPMSTSTLPVALATAFALGARGGTKQPTAMTNPFITYRTRFGAAWISFCTRARSFSNSARSSSVSGLRPARLENVPQPETAIGSFLESIQSRASSAPKRDSAATQATVYSEIMPQVAVFAHF